MNEQEREVIADIFRRLEKVANEPRDPEAERFIVERLRHQPYAPYAMTQTIFVQERALSNLQAEVEALRSQVAEASRARPHTGGLLSSLFGGGRTQPDHRTGSRAAQQGSPWGVPSVTRRSDQFAGGQPGGERPGPWGGAAPASAMGGGFLQGALSTAAGVAGGMMLGNALTSAFSGKGAEAAGADKAGLADTASAEAPGDDASITNSLYDQPSEEQSDDFSDFGDGGDSGDWA